MMDSKKNDSYKVYANSIYILESIKNELRTGKQLYENIVAYSHKFKILNIEYFEFKSRDVFFELLDTIKTRIVDENKMPLIHIEAHGDSDGFEVAQTSESITWRDLNMKLIDLNLQCQGNLIISLGICKGHFVNLDLMLLLNEDKRCPFAVCIGPVDKIYPNAIQEGFTNFYESLLENKDFELAMREMQKVTELNILMTGEKVIKDMIIDLKNHHKSIKFSDRMAHLLDEKIKNDGKPLPNENYNRNLKWYKKQYKIKERIILKNKWEYFLMFDLFQENKNRYTNFEMLWPE